jgi:hypothetical protein
MIAFPAIVNDPFHCAECGCSLMDDELHRQVCEWCDIANDDYGEPGDFEPFE